MRSFLVLLFCAFHGICMCQDSITLRMKPDTSAPAPPDTSAPSKAAIMIDNLQKNQKLKKAIKIFSYLNYCDIRVDRPIQDARAFECYKGKRIRRLEVEVVYPYGVSLDSPYYYHPTKGQAMANKFQFSTRDQVIKNEVLFKEGDVVDPQLFADTERNLWEKNIYKDIRILIEEIGDDMVDVTIYVRDRFNIGLLTSAGYNNIQVGLVFNNLFGVSQIVQVDGTFYFRKFATYRVHLSYAYNNIRSTFINVGFSGSYDILNQTGTFVVNRNFFSVKTEWAGRILFNISRNNLVLPSERLGFSNAWVSTASEDLWLARAFKLSGSLGQKYPLSRIIVSARMQRTDYMNRPYVLGPKHIINFINQNSILGAVGLARWDYYIDHNVYSLDKAEYFTKGVSAGLIGGFQIDEILQRRTYLAGTMQFGAAFTNAGYWLTFFKAGAFVNPHTVDQALLDWENTFYTIPVKMGRSWNMRSFITTDIKLGFSRPVGREIVINNSNDLRGLSSVYLRGIRTYGLSYEADFYYTRKVVGFSTSFFFFGDLSLIDISADANRFQSGVGGGLRLRNLNIGLGFIEITVAYYPKLNVPDQRPFSLMGNIISNRTPIKKDLFSPDIVNVD